jgi:hypothetical protein
MRLVALLEQPARIARYLAAVGEATELPRGSPEPWSAVLEKPAASP